MSIKKTTAEHFAEVKSFGVFLLKDDYKGAKNKTTYYCPKHDFIVEALSGNALKGWGLICCRNPTTAPTTGRKSMAMHAEEVWLLEQIQLASNYIDEKTRCTYRRLVHNEEHEPLPSNVLKGIGLKCCECLLGAATNIREHEESHDGSFKEIGFSLDLDRPGAVVIPIQINPSAGGCHEPTTSVMECRGEYSGHGG